MTSTHKKKARKPAKAPRHYTHYSLIDVMMASTTAPLAPANHAHQLGKIWAGVAEIESAATPSADAWRVCSDAVNLVETLVLHGPWPDCDGDLVEIEDASGLLSDAIKALVRAGKSLMAGQPAALCAADLVALRGVVQDYSDLAAALPARTMLRCHRATERRLRVALEKTQQLPDGVHIVAI